jgi:hypothetical protein
MALVDDSKRKRQLRRHNHEQIKVWTDAAHFRRENEGMFREENKTNVQKAKSKIQRRDSLNQYLGALRASRAWESYGVNS